MQTNIKNYSYVRKYTDIGYNNEAKQNQKHIDAYEKELKERESNKKENETERSM
ncbi:MAG: hypothetical protein IJZ29_03375 [Clostridia bacterium]|nr:hypothetical protein [Clostridia bacterium]